MGENKTISKKRGLRAAREHVVKMHPSIFMNRKRRPNIVLSIALMCVYLCVLLGICLGAAGFGAFLGIAKAYLETTPVLDLGRLEEQDETSFIYDSTGQMITSFKLIENRTSATIDEIPEDLKNAFIAIEDIRFYSHDGVDFKRLIGSFLYNLTSTTTQGGSTITQQLIKNRLLTFERSYKRKIQEAYLAMQLEQKYSKDQILEAYLNTINMGESNYGVKAAAKDYFNKELSELTLRECAMLAAINQNPSFYNPRANFYSRNMPERVNDRTDLVLRTMYRNGLITQNAYEAALRQTLKIVEHSPQRELYDMPYFIEYGIYNVVTHMLHNRNLADTGTNRSMMEKELRTGGYHIYLTVDTRIQKIAEETIYNWTNYPVLRNSADSVDRTRNPDGSIVETIQPQAASVIIDQHTGEIKAMVGGRSAPTAQKQLNRAYQAHIPVGSSMKPIGVYGPALDLGYSPGSPVFDGPAKIPGWNTERGYPTIARNQNTFVSLRHAIVFSLNIAAARTLLEYVTAEKSMDYLDSLGIPRERLQPSGSDLALGTADISPLEMAGAFSAIANRGTYQPPIAFSLVKDGNGNVVLDARQYQAEERRQALKPSTSWMLTDMLTEAVARGTGTRARLSSMPTAGKTGTNSDYRGVFFAGFTPYYTCSVWVGHDKYKPFTSAAQGGLVCAPIFKAIMEQVHEGLESKPILADTAESLGLERRTVCSVSGLQPTEACQHDAIGLKPTTDYFLRGTYPQKKCDMHISAQVCTVSNKLATPYCPSSAIAEKSLMLIPEDSSLRTMKPEDMQRLLPHAVTISLEKLEALRPGDPEYAEHYCQVHIEERVQQTARANSIMTTVKQYIITSTELAPADRSLLEEQMRALDTLLLAQVGNDVVTEAMNKLISSAQRILGVSP